MAPPRCRLPSSSASSMLLGLALDDAASASSASAGRFLLRDAEAMIYQTTEQCARLTYTRRNVRSVHVGRTARLAAHEKVATGRKEACARTCIAGPTSYSQLSARAALRKSY